MDIPVVFTDTLPKTNDEEFTKVFIVEFPTVRLAVRVELESKALATDSTIEFI